MMPEIRKVAIVGGSRIPFVRSNTDYSHASNMDMLTAALQGLVERFDLDGERLGEVVAGAVMKHSRDFNLAREATLDSGLSLQTPAYDIQQACGTGLEAAILVANKIALGQINSGIAGGTDTASDAPIALNEKYRHMILSLNRAKTLGQRLKLFASIRPSFMMPLLPANAEPRTGLSMGQHCELMVKQWGISREDQDQLTFNSHQNLIAAYDRGFFADLVRPFCGVERDGIMRNTPLEKLAALKPAYDRENGTLTAANSTTLTDGAAAVLLASEDWAKERNLPIQAYLTHSEVAAVDFYSQGEKSEGLLMAPAYAVPRLLARAGLMLQDFDFYEIHEAFAAQVIAVVRDSGLDPDRTNPNGGAIALGHPVGATGTILTIKMLHDLQSRDLERGLVTMCIGGGQALAAVFERV